MVLCRVEWVGYQFLFTHYQIGDDFVEFEIGTEYEGFFSPKKIFKKKDDENKNNISNRRTPLVVIDRSLDKYRDKIMFPKKLERANKI